MNDDTPTDPAVTPMVAAFQQMADMIRMAVETSNGVRQQMLTLGWPEQYATVYAADVLSRLTTMMFTQVIT